MNELERRVRICRMLEKMNRSREYSAVLKLEDKSIIKLKLKEGITNAKKTEI